MSARVTATEHRTIRPRAPLLIALGCATLLSGCGGEATFFLSSMNEQQRLPNGAQITDLGDRTTFGDIQCDQSGHYLGGGSPQSEQIVKTGLERGIDDAKTEMNDLNRAIDICKGRQKGMEDFKAQYGCDEARIDQLAAQAETVRSKIWPIDQQISDLAEENASADYLLKNEKYMPAAIHARLMDRITQNTSRQLLLQLEVRPLRAEAERLEKERWQMYSTCDKARAAAWDDPCFIPNVTEMMQSRRSLEQRVRGYEQRLDRFKDCSEDRVRQAQRSTPSRSGDTAVPGLILQQVLPGLLVQPHRPSHGSRDRHDSDHKHQGGHWDDHKK